MKWVVLILLVLMSVPFVGAAEDSGGTCSVISAGPYNVTFRTLSIEGSAIADASVRISNSTWYYLGLTNSTGYLTTLTLVVDNYNIIVNKGDYENYLIPFMPTQTGVENLMLTPAAENLLLIGLVLGGCIITLVLYLRSRS